MADGNFVLSVGVFSDALRQRLRPLGRYFPKGKLLVKHQSAPIPDALAIEQGDVTSQDAACRALDPLERSDSSSCHSPLHSGRTAHSSCRFTIARSDRRGPSNIQEKPTQWVAEKTPWNEALARRLL